MQPTLTVRPRTIAYSMQISNNIRGEKTVLSYLRMSVYHQWQNYGHEQHRSMLHSLLPNICISKTQEIVKRRLSGTRIITI